MKKSNIFVLICLFFLQDVTACEWAHTLETIVKEVQKKCNKSWEAKFSAHLETLRDSTCVEPDDCKSGDHNCHSNSLCNPKKGSHLTYTTL